MKSTQLVVLCLVVFDVLGVAAIVQIQSTPTQPAIQQLATGNITLEATCSLFLCRFAAPVMKNDLMIAQVACNQTSNPPQVFSFPSAPWKVRATYTVKNTSLSVSEFYSIANSSTPFMVANTCLHATAFTIYEISGVNVITTFDIETESQ